MKNKNENQSPKIQEVSLGKLVNADWNYKEKGTPEMIQKLAESVKRDKSLGVVAVRELDDGNYEVIDGNHRLEAARFLKMEKLTVENFGKLSKSDAVLIARRRNHQWFREDVVLLASLYADVVVPEISIDDLSTFMPETKNDLADLIRMAEGTHVPNMDGKENKKAKVEERVPSYSLSFIPEQYEVIQRAIEAIRASEGDTSITKSRAVELICADYLSGAKQTEISEGQQLADNR